LVRKPSAAAFEEENKIKEKLVRKKAIAGV